MQSSLVKQFQSELTGLSMKKVPYIMLTLEPTVVSSENILSSSPFTFSSFEAVVVHLPGERAFLVDTDHFYWTKFVWLHAKCIQY